MKNTTKIVFCGLMAALATVVMLVAYFPYLTYAVPAVASLFIMVVFIELGLKWGIMTYFASILPILLFAELEAKILYIAFFGFYPLLKAVIERVSTRVAEWFIKFVSFNLIIVLTYLFISFVVGIKLDDMGELGKYGSLILLAMGNLVFVAYDICIERIAGLYYIRFHNTVKKIISR